MNRPPPAPDARRADAPAAADPGCVDEALARWFGEAPALPMAVALSGGADSTALLIACAERWPGAVQAWHVHHGLQSAADDFERHCRALCQRLGVPLRVQRVRAAAAPGQSPEDAARIARYECFEALVGSQSGLDAIQTVAMAHHADDQVETLLLALSRGAGLPGLAAMPARWRRAGVAWCRPLLDVPGPAIRAWLRARDQAWVEDPTNADRRYTRNRIRAELLPALQAAFPAFRTTFARSARHAAQGQVLLEELAADDLARVGVPPAITALQALSAPRQANLLRHWLARAHGTTPTAAQLAELVRQIDACRTRGHTLHLKVGAGHVRRAGDRLVWQAAGANPDA